MKPSRFLTAIYLLATALAVGGCTQDEGMDGNGTPLPEGKYPLMLTATQNEVVASPQTRVADYEEGGNQKSKWTASDQIKVAVSEGGNDMATTCTLGENGNITGYKPQLYWKTTQTSKINAWYSNITEQSTTGTTVSLANQSSGLAYVLKADEKTGQNYNSGNISLQFKHQLAKVRVKVVKGGYMGNLNVTAVSVKGYTSCTVSNGTVTASGTLGDITTKKTDIYWEANLVPGASALSKTITIAADNKITTCTLAADVSLASGNVYTYTVTVNAAGPTTYPAGSVIPEITDDGEYIIEGNGNQTTNGIVISGSPTVTLKNVNISAGTAIEIKNGGNPTIIIENTCVLKSTGWYSAGIHISKGSLTLYGTGSLDVTGGRFSAGIGIGMDGYFSDITIRNLTVKATGGEGGAGIGTGINGYQGRIMNVGTIHIYQADVTAIGTYDLYSNQGAAAIGCGAIYSGEDVTMGDIYIETSKTKDTFLAKLTKGGNGTQRIGKGTSNGSGSFIIGKVKINASDGFSEYNNGVD